jgi:hypothetical protein
MQTENYRNRTVQITEFIVLLTVLMIPSFLFVTTQSFWGDEASTAWFADHSRSLNPAEFHFLAAVPQMPLYHVLLVPWAHSFGDSEQALRAINLPFAALFLGSLLWISRRPGARFWWLPALPFAVFPLLTYYVNECRPYAALLAISAAAGAAFFSYLRTHSRAAAYLCCLFSLISFSTHLLGILTPFILVAYVLFCREARMQLAQTWKTWITPFLLSLPGYLALLLYYVHAKAEGIPHGQMAANPDTPGNVASNWKNVVFFFYETLGFSGLGPPRNALRVHAGLHSFHGYFGLLLIGAVAAIALVVLFWRAGIKPGKIENTRAMIAAAITGLALLFVVARAIHFGFFGRHGMAIIGLICCFIVIALSAEGVTAKTRWAVVILLTLVWGISSIRLLTIYPYGKDDVRAALQAASAIGLPILWNAETPDAAYYGAYDTTNGRSQTFNVPGVMPTAHWKPVTNLHILYGLEQSDVDRKITPYRGGKYVLVSGKSDAFDPTNVWSENRALWHAVLINQFNGFDLWIVSIPVKESLSQSAVQ